MDFRHVTQDQREALYDEVWTEPVTTVAKKYNMSDNGLRKHCKRLWIPLPPIGYWAKVKAGQVILKHDLPKVRGELKRYVRNYYIKFRLDIDQLTDSELIVNKELSLLTEETKSSIRETCSKIQVMGKLRNPNDLITKHKEESIYRKKRDKVLQQAKVNPDYYRITKEKYRENEAMLPIYVSDFNANRAYRILNTLIETFDDMEGYTRVSLESGKDIAYFIVMQSNIYFELKGDTRRKSTVSDETEVPLPLVLSILAKDWFREGVKYKLEYKDKETEPLEKQLEKIIYDTFDSANKILVEQKLEDSKSQRASVERERQRSLE